ncbi:M15 family metallopeptidase [Mesonia aestuariivivens]|uniref:D-alanyl-D-alanine dipeptidase n=1 Tax=Mesonia aestuariivivens TaxID=2796128 RepID=A0ABS6VYR3_9FLAO|nr:M15 family metallopeptidase [Mesonia aestuariivivens]MBW2960725.1 M15 family metallopeptidase [Mesonia aestuariivivens]
MRNIILFIILIPLLSTSQANKKLPQFVNLKTYDDSFSYDIRYATSNNFLNQPIYDCAKCLLLPEAAEALAKANNYFCDLGYQIKIFDCYRPLSAQKKMWEIYPNPRYVANPYTKKSVHNRGAAVDLTLVNLETEKEINMGTSYDFFGKEAHQDNYKLPKDVLTNRKLLREVLEKFGFHIIRTEWWHYDFGKAYSYPVYDIEFSCP